MTLKLKVLSAAAVASLLFAGCAKEETKKSEAQDKKAEQSVKKEETKQQEADFVQAYKDGVTELEKAKDGKEVDFDKVTKLYKEKLQALVQQRDGEFNEQIDQTITAALEAGKKKEMEPMVVKQLFDKLMQKEFFQSMRHDFKEVDEKWGKKDDVKKEMEEALAFYKGLEGTVGKRDTAYGTQMASQINGGFDEMKAAIDKGDKLAFALGKQVVDKTLMKTFYFATGALPNGYATKMVEEAKKDEKNAKVEQAEGWAFYQAIYSYMKKAAPEDADFILKQFDLKTDVKTVDAKAVNQAFVRGFAKVALGEYKESKENFGKDKGPITALEGALFINIIENDLKTVLGEQQTVELTKTAQSYLDAVKAKKKEDADKLLPQLESALNKAVEAAK
ncbi:hypothetical protein COL32_04670 [Bacillus pseudomycoides]|uniref:hypothetical protein n=1 Tax=Bacillus pseudomycoides TaxID=64104 RepID=UPI000BF34195|nr:hypothetical protein [Bacillus pseudomycoides]PFW97531.1 hypothetical protein COL29_03035 [Bacillus pseudomycoides]PFX47304.1 hypothetical protein COL32_04670 [Bacillus pseudomycoides]